MANVVERIEMAKNQNWLKKMAKKIFCSNLLKRYCRISFCIIIIIFTLKLIFIKHQVSSSALYSSVLTPTSPTKKKLGFCHICRSEEKSLNQRTSKSSNEHVNLCKNCTLFVCKTHLINLCSICWKD